MSLKFYTDVHIDKQVALQLRSKGVEVIRCQEVGMAMAQDEAHLEYAAANDLALVTKDDDFIALHAMWQSETKQHAGIFFCPYRDQPAIGLIVTECLYYYEAVEGKAGSLEQDIRNQVHYIT